jgi:hypothetical protein
MAAIARNGARLAYVVVPVKGAVSREIISIETKAQNKDGKATMVDFKRKKVDQPAGYIVYFPRGHAIRLRSQDELRRYGLDKPAQIISMTGLNDPNSPVGRLMAAQDDEARRQIMVDMQQQVIQLATAKSGPITVEVK